MHHGLWPHGNPLWIETDTTENITFPQLRLRVVKMVTFLTIHLKTVLHVFSQKDPQYVTSAEFCILDFFGPVHKNAASMTIFLGIAAAAMNGCVNFLLSAQ